jgi:hypothetical protein
MTAKALQIRDGQLFAQDAGGSPQWTIKLFIASVEMTHLLLERQQQILHSTSLRAGSSGMTRQASKCKNVERCRKKDSKGRGELSSSGSFTSLRMTAKALQIGDGQLSLRMTAKALQIGDEQLFAQDAGGSPQWTIKLFIASVEMTHHWLRGDSRFSIPAVSSGYLETSLDLGGGCGGTGLAISLA